MGRVQTLPDMFADDIDPGMFQTWAKQGVLKPLPDHLSPYPNLEKMMSNESVLPLKVDGKFYSIPRFGGEDIRCQVRQTNPLSEGLGGASRIYKNSKVLRNSWQ